MISCSGERTRGKCTAATTSCLFCFRTIAQKVKKWQRRWILGGFCRCNWPNRLGLSLISILLFVLFLMLLWNCLQKLLLQLQSASSSSTLRRYNAQHLSSQQQLEASVKSVLATDRMLHVLAAAESSESTKNAQNFVHPNFALLNGSGSLANFESFGPTMKTAQELVEATKVLIDVERPCGGDGGARLTLLVLIFCSASDFSRRQAIRETFGTALKANPVTELYFVLGRVEDDSLEAQLRNESLHYNDILQFAFSEHYYNLTLKSVGALRWTALHCSLAAFTFKLDDDCFIRVRPLLAQLQALITSADDPSAESSPSADLYGPLRTQEAVIRDPAVRYAVAPRYWPYPHYPPFLAGLYLIRGGTAAGQLYGAIVSPPTTDTLPALFIEDAYVSGVLAAKANLTIGDLPGVITLFEDDKWRQLEIAEAEADGEGGQQQQQQYTVFYETLEEEDLRRFWLVLGDQ